MVNYKWIESIITNTIEPTVNRLLRTYSPMFGYIAEINSKQVDTLTVTIQGDSSSTAGVLYADGFDFVGASVGENVILIRLNGSVKGSSYIAIKNIG